MRCHTPSLAICFSLALLGLVSSAVRAQTGDGLRSQDTPGLVLAKPQAWSKDDQATALEFLAVTNRSGYYEFRTAKNPAYQIPAAKVVKLVIYPAPPQTLSTAEERASLQATLDEFAAISAKFPIAARHLDKALAPLKADASKYDSGSVKENGQWVAKSAHYRQKAGSLSDLLRQELMAAPDISEVDLSSNQYFIGLQDMAKTEPSVRPVLDGIKALYDSLVRKKKRDALLTDLNAPSLGYEQAVELVAQLKALKPEEDARANLFVKSWDTAMTSAGRLGKQITDTQGQFENVMPASDQAPAKVPTIPPELAAQIVAMTAAVRQYRAASPPTVILVPLALADAMTSCNDNFSALDKQIQDREYLEAKALLDPLTVKADLIGPRTSAVLAGLQKKIGADIEKFQLLRNEAKMLAENDKIEDALKKYQEAYAIIPSKEVSAQMEILKKQ